MAAWIGPGISADRLRRALDRLEASFLEERSPEALIARREAGLWSSEDETLAAMLASELVGRQQADGSWDGDLCATAHAVVLLAELGPSVERGPIPSAVERATDWLHSRRGAPGRFGDGCTPDLHRLGFCHHFLGGFFAPTFEARDASGPHNERDPHDDRDPLDERGASDPPESPDPAVRLPCGAEFAPGPVASLVASCAALLALLKWGRVGPDARLHLDGVRRLLLVDPREVPGLVPLEAIPALVHVLLAAPERGDADPAVRRGLGRLTQVQRADGSWPEMDALCVLDVLIAASRAGHGNDAVAASLRRGAGLLAVTQRDEGTWERNGSAWRSLIAWRTLRFAVESCGGRAS